MLGFVIFCIIVYGFLIYSYYLFAARDSWFSPFCRSVSRCTSSCVSPMPGGSNTTSARVSPVQSDIEEDEQPKFRVCLMGESQVGKTSLVSQCLTSDYMNTYDASLGEIPPIPTPALPSMLQMMSMGRRVSVLLWTGRRQSSPSSTILAVRCR